MNVNQLKQAVPVMTKHNVVPFIWGMQGIGKTQTLKQIAAEMGYKEDEESWTSFGFVHLHLATQEVGDLVGLLKHNKDGTVSHARPEWFPKSQPRGILFLDELNRAHPDVIQACFSLITSRTIHTHRLPAGWKIVAAGNYQTDEFTVTDTSDSAWMSRFCHIHFEPTASEFIAFAESRKAFTVADFIAEHPELLEKKGKRPDINITPDRRAWLEMIAPLEKENLDEETRMEIYSGIVGQVAASRFMNFKNSKERRIRLRDIMRDYSAVREQVLSCNRDKDTRYDALNAPISELETKLDQGHKFSTEELMNLKEYLLDIPKELLSQTFKKLGRGGAKSKVDTEFMNTVFNDPAFAKRFFK
jgi:hypothetical protein